MRVLIIGGTGFIGCHVTRQLADKGNEVAVFHRGVTQTELPGEVHHIFGDRQSLADFKDAFEHFAPRVVIDMTAYIEAEARLVMETCRGIAERLVTLSSQDVYRNYELFTRIEQGESVPVPYDEDSPLRESHHPYRRLAESATDMFYHYDKIPIERLVMNDKELRGTVLRLPQVYGEGDKHHRFFNYLKQIDDGRPYILLGRKKSYWRWTRGYVEDIANAITLAATREEAANRIYNVGDSAALTEDEWVRLLAQATNWNGEIKIIDEESLPAHLVEPYDWQHHLFADTTRIRQELGFSEGISRGEALRRTIDWERANPPSVMNEKQFDYAAEDARLAAIP